MRRPFCSGCGGVLCILQILLPICWPFVCGSNGWCAKNKREVMAWNAELLSWQRRFNEQVLVPKGMFVKTKSRCDVYYNGKMRHS